LAGFGLASSSGATDEKVESHVTIFGGAGGSSGGAVAIAASPEGTKVERKITVIGKGGAGGGGGAVAIAGSGGDPKVIEIRRVVGGEEGASEGKEVAFLGVGTEEAPEALASQLKLKNGEGLVVTYVGSDSPAAKAGIQKNDVLLELDGQMLVLPAQLRKLVQSRAEGDEVTLTILRSGQREQIKATLGKTKVGVALLGDGATWTADLQDLGRHLRELRIDEQVGEGMKDLRESLAKAGVNKEAIRIEVRKGIEEARKALDEALRSSGNASRAQITAERVLKDLYDKGITIDKDASVTVKSHGRQIRTIVQTDDTGTFVLIADPKKRLTAHDKDGNLIFDGEIETEEQMEKVPPSIRDRVKKMVDELSKAKAPQVLEDEGAEEKSSLTETPDKKG